MITGWLSGGIVAGIYLFVRLMLCGFWFGLRPGLHFLERSGRMVLFGLLLNLMPALVLGVLGIWSPVVDVLLWLCISLMAAGYYFTQHSDVRTVARSWHALVLPFVVIVCAVFLPAPSEWLVGGWDPGLYQTSSVEIARNNGTQPFLRKLFSELSQDERQMLSREENGYHEVMPGVPITIRDGQLHHYFFPLTPIYGAWLYRIGGLSFLVKSSMFVAFLGVILFGGLAFRLLGSIHATLICIFFLLISPMWWYHQGVPTSEMLQLFLLSGGILEYLRIRNSSCHPWWLMLLAFGLTVNRFSDPPVLAILLCFAGIGAAWSEREKAFPKYWAAVGCGCIVGMLWILAFFPITIVRLEEKDAALTIVATVFFVFFIVAGLLNHFLPKLFAVPLKKALLIAMVLLGFGSVILSVPGCYDRIMLFFAPVPWLCSFLQRYTRLVAYQGIFFWMLAIIGFIVAFAKNDGEKRVPLLFVLCSFLAVTFVFLVSPGIAPFYPWALRRYIVFVIPFLALSQGIALLWACRDWQTSWRIRISKLCVLLVCFGAILQGVHISYTAMQAGDYVGMIGFLQQIESRLQSDDLVIADDARWATPLLFVSGRNVIDGGVLWQNPDPAERKLLIDRILVAGREGGTRVVWVTSTDEGVALYNLDWLNSNIKEIGDEISFSYPTVIHSSRANTYGSSNHERIFRFWVLKDGPDAP